MLPDRGFETRGRVAGRDVMNLKDEVLGRGFLGLVGAFLGPFRDRLPGIGEDKADDGILRRKADGFSRLEQRTA